MKSRYSLALLAFLGGVVSSGVAHATPTPASAIATASAGFTISLTNGAIVDMFVSTPIETLSSSGPQALSISLGANLATNCAVSSSACNFVGGSGGIALAVDGSASAVTASGGIALILALSEPGTLTIASIGRAVVATPDVGAEPTGFASSETFISELLLAGIETFSLAEGELRSFSLDAGAYALSWGGVVAVAAAARTVEAVAEPASLAIALAMGAGLAAIRRDRSVAG